MPNIPETCWKNAQDCLVSLCRLPLEKRTGYPPEQLHFTQGIPAPLPRRDPRTCWKTTQDRPVSLVALYTGLAVFGLFATLRRLLSAQENGGGMHRLQLVEHTGLRC